MSKRSATSTLNHDNWNDEEAKEEMGMFTKASPNELKMRSIRRGKRRGVDNDGQAPSVFKNFTAFGGLPPSATVPSFSFLNPNSEPTKLANPSPFPSFSFGNANNIDSSKSNSEKPPSFSFVNSKDNSSPNAEKTSTLSFGNTQNATNINSEKPPLFSFGNTKETNIINSEKPPTLTFGNAQKDVTTHSGKLPGFSFGNSKDNSNFTSEKTAPFSNSDMKAPTINYEKPPTFGLGNESNVKISSSSDKPSSAFSFGSPKGISNPNIEKNPTFSFGNTNENSKTSSEKNTNFSFGSPKESTSSNLGKPPTFGFRSTTDNSISSGKLPTFSFGNAAGTNQANSDKPQLSFNSSFDSDKKTPKTNTSSVPMFKSGSHSVEAKPKQIFSPSNDESKCDSGKELSNKNTGFKFGIGVEKLPDSTASPSLPAVGFNLDKSTVSPSSFKFGIKSASESNANQSPISNKLVSEVQSNTKLNKECFGKPSTSVANSNNEGNKTFKSDSLGKSDDNYLFLANLRALNIGVVSWIKQHLDKNEFINLCPIFEDYKTHLLEIKKKYDRRLSKCDEGNQDSTKNSGNIVESKKTKEVHLTIDSQSKLTDSSKVKNSCSFESPKAPCLSFCSSSSKIDQSNGNENSKPSSFVDSSNVKTDKESPFTSLSSHKPLNSTSQSDKLGKDSIEKDANDKNSGFSFGPSGSNTPVFSFGSKDSTSKGFSFGSNDSKPTGFSFNSSEKKTTGFSFGTSDDNKATGFSFGSSSSSPQSFSFNKASNPSFQFSGSSSAETKETTETNVEKGQEESDEPPREEVKEVKEENAVYEKKVKLFYKKDNNYVDKGVGTLFLKPAGDKTQLIIRALTNLGNILLNIILNDSLPTQRMGKNNVLLVCVANPPFDAKSPNVPVSILIRVKTSEDADELLSKIDEYKK